MHIACSGKQISSMLLEQMKTGKWKKAVIYLNQAETWPENLFSGEPYLPDNRITQFLRAYCFDKLKIRSEADKAFTYITEYKNPDGWTSNAGNRLTVLVSGGTGITERSRRPFWMRKSVTGTAISCPPS